MQPLSNNRADSIRQDALTIVVLFTAALCIRLYSLQFFHVISTDGTSYALNARALAQGDLHGLAVSGFYPVLIALANIWANDLETAGRLVSVILGSLLVVPLYLLGKSVFSRQTAIAASLVAVVWPSLVASSCEVMTQASHTTLQLASIYLIWLAFKKQTVANGIMAGLIIGITYLTRAESLLLFVFMPLALAALEPEKLMARKQLLSVYCLGFLIPFTLNAILVYHVTGEWQLSAKTDSALNDALSYYLNIPDIIYTPGYEPKSYLDIIREYPGFIWHNSSKNLKELWLTLLPPGLWALFAVGFFSGGISRESNRRRLFLLSTVTPIAVLVVFYYISSGYIQAYQPFIFLFAAHGFTVTADKLMGLLPARRGNVPLSPPPLLLMAALIYSAILFAPQIRKNISDAEYWPRQDSGRRSEKHIGILLKNNLPPGKIMTRWARIAFYAERESVTVPAAYFDEIIDTARKNNVRFFIADGYLLGNRPGLGEEIFKPFGDRTIPPGLYFYAPDTPAINGLRPYMIYRHHRSMGVIVYEISY